MAVQLSLVKTLDPGFTDGLGTAVLHGIKGLGFFLIDAADVADGVGKVRTQRVVADELGLDVHPWKTELVDGQNGDLFFVQLIEQRDRNKRVTSLLKRLIEHGTVFGRQMQQIDDRVQLTLEISGAFPGDCQVVTRTVVGQDYTITVIDQAASRRDRQYMDPVVFRDCGVVVVLHYLQKIQTPHQGTSYAYHQQCTGEQALVDQAVLFFVIFDRYRFRHFYSISLENGDAASCG